MIDSNGYVLDQTGDGGDSCNFTCALYFFKDGGPNLIWEKFITDEGEGPVRHPWQKPWDNPKNFTVDQQVPWIAIAPAHTVREYFKKHWLFAPNTERDWPGSRKMRKPHWFYKDSHLWDGDRMIIDTKTVTDINLLFTNFRHEVEHKKFDSADLQQGPSFGQMVIKGKIWWLYWTLPVCYLWCVASILAHCHSAKDKDYNDFKQMFIVSTFYKLDKFFCKRHPRGLFEASLKYFVIDRDLKELHIAFLDYCKRRGIYEYIKAPETGLGN